MYNEGRVGGMRIDDGEDRGIKIARRTEMGEEGGGVVFLPSLSEVKSLLFSTLPFLLALLRQGSQKPQPVLAWN